MKKITFFCSLAVMMGGALTSCNDDNPGADNKFPVISNGRAEAYILTQGNYYSKVEGGLNVISLFGGNMEENIFQTVNKRSIGATPQCGLAYGGKIYIGTYESNTIEIIDRYTYESKKQIVLSTREKGRQPRSMVAYGKNIYISMYDGYVARLDTLTKEIDAVVKVGPNPEKMCLKDGKLYVPNSDGMNYANDYADGTTVSVVNLSPFQVEKTLTVPLNPGSCVTAGNDVFVLCKGDYKSIPSKLYRIESDGTTTPIVEATMVASGSSTVYIIDAHWDGSGNNYYKYFASTKELYPMEIEGIDYPNGIGVNEKENVMIISSNVWGSGMPAYDLPGYVVEMDLNGKEIKRFDSGVGEASIFFSPDRF